ncbi:MAG: cysteine desulfurase family protein [Pyrinomonadaceae bacterium]
MIYFDNNATTPIAPEAAAAIVDVLENDYGNPSSAHTMGRRARDIVEAARSSVAGLIGANSPDEIVFTSGGTESDNFAILGALRASPEKRHIVTTRVEHEAVRKLAERLETDGFEVTWIDVDEYGALDVDAFRYAIRPDTAVVSAMLANNETGVIFPMAELAAIVKDRSSAMFHVDGVNAAGKMPIALGQTAVDLFSISAHKFNGPKGAGALYIRDGVKIPSMYVGGGQESGRRAGTEPMHQIAGMGAAAKLAIEVLPLSATAKLRETLENGILQKIPNSRLNGTKDTALRLPNTSNVSLKDTNGEMIMAILDKAGVCVSTGSACNSENHMASAVLQAMNVPYSWAMGSIRFSLGRYNTAAEVDKVLTILPNIVADLRAMG